MGKTPPPIASFMKHCLRKGGELISFVSMGAVVGVTLEESFGRDRAVGAESPSSMDRASGVWPC
jgi:hypothetical protein